MPQHTLPLLSLRATLPGGLMTEPAGKAGLGRLAANLLVKGTRLRNAEQLASEVEQLGGLAQFRFRQQQRDAFAGTPQPRTGNQVSISSWKC